MISPTAQAVLDAYEFTADAAADSDDLNALAAALRAVAPLMEFVQDHQKLLGIAAELEDAHD